MSPKPVLSSPLPLHQSDYPAIVAVWEASVRATHHFLSETDIQFFKPLILNEFLDAVQLSGIKDEQGGLVAFMGTATGKLEMLFVHPDAMGHGIGRLLMRYAIENDGVKAVDVNEQNEQAVGFYRHQGFEVISRSEVDGIGKPFPILSMALIKQD